jgi:glycosyltransferase involved in cell wall biosynthesis
MRRLDPVLRTLAVEYELVLVNDGSRDRSWTVIQKLAAENRGSRDQPNAQLRPTRRAVVWDLAGSCEGPDCVQSQRLLLDLMLAVLRLLLYRLL